MIDAPITFDQPAFDPSETYTLQQDGSVMRGSDSASIPADAGNAAYRAFLAWQATGKTPAPVPAPPFSAGSVKAECGRRIYAVASDNAQKNMLATIVADGMSAVDKATFAAGVTWIAAMQASCRDMIVAADPLFADDAKWPAIPPGVAELAARF